MTGNGIGDTTVVRLGNGRYHTEMLRAGPGAVGMVTGSGERTALLGLWYPRDCGTHFKPFRHISPHYLHQS